MTGPRNSADDERHGTVWQTVACVNCKLKEIEALPDSRHRPQWFPLYGPPLVVPTSTELAEIAKRMTSSEVKM